MTQKTTTKNSHLKHMTKAAQQAGPKGTHPATKIILRKPASITSTKRSLQYTRIERGYRA